MKWLLLTIFISGDVFKTPTSALYQFDSYEACQKELFEIFYFDLEGKITSMTQYARDF